MAYMAIVVGLSIRVMPPASASADTPSSSALRAVPRATRLEEHAVSTAMLGPLRPYRYEMRPVVAQTKAWMQLTAAAHSAAFG